MGHPHEYPWRLGLEHLGAGLRGNPSKKRSDSDRHQRCRESCSIFNAAVWKLTSNLFTDLPSKLPNELITTLLAATNLRIERIVSHGHASPDGFWYDQDQHEWVVVLQGAARLSIEGAAKELMPGDYINIPAHQKHRVEWTTPEEPTVWLAVFYGEANK